MLVMVPGVSDAAEDLEAGLGKLDPAVADEGLRHAGHRRGVVALATDGVPGKVADVVVVEGDPFAFATLVDRIEQVWKAGRRLV